MEVALSQNYTWRLRCWGLSKSTATKAIVCFRVSEWKVYPRECQIVFTGSLYIFTCRSFKQPRNADRFLRDRHQWTRVSLQDLKGFHRPRTTLFCILWQQEILSLSSPPLQTTHELKDPVGFLPVISFTYQTLYHISGVSFWPVYTVSLIRRWIQHGHTHRERYQHHNADKRKLENHAHHPAQAEL